MTKQYVLTEDNLHAILSRIGDKLGHANIEVWKSDILQSLTELTGEPVAVRYKDHSDKRWQFCNIQGSELLHDFLIKQPLYTSPHPLQPITADMVTGEMVVAFLQTDRSTTQATFMAAVNAWIKHRDTK